MEHNQDNFQRRDGRNSSLWQEIGYAIKAVSSKSIGEHQIFDTLIIGAGITGVTTALLLQRSGQNCVLVEAENYGFGTTGGTSAHLNTFFDATYPEIESDFGEAEAALVAKAGKEAFALIKNFVDDLDLDCDLEFKPAYLYSENEKESKQLQQILEASQRAGVHVALSQKNGLAVPFESALQFNQQGQFHPMKYLSGLLKEFIDLGGLFLENTRIKESEFENGIHTAKSDLIRIQSRNLVWATHIPPGINLLSLRNAPYRSYVLGLRLKTGEYPDCLSYDMQEPYHYYRTHVVDGQSYLIVGGEDHKTGHGDPEAAFSNLEGYVRQYYDVAEVAYKWSAQYYVPVDGLPYIGQLTGGADATYVATGFNGNGMIFGTLSGKIISDLVMGRDNEYSSLFSPSRLKPVAGFTEFVKENADVAWHFVKDRLTPEQLDKVTELKKGSGVIAEYEGKRMAFYKDDAGAVTALNPTCTHAACIVQFNDVEKSWDCPCHGGRFDVYGKVLTGPPTKDLEQVMINYDKK